MGQFPQMNDRQHLLAESVDNPRPLLGWFPDTDDGPAGTEQIGPRTLTVASSDGTDYLWVGGEFTRIASNGNRLQQGLVRFADTPDTRAPSVPEQTVAVNASGGRTQFRWQAGLDLDDTALTYTVYRDGAAVGTVTGSSTFWQRPTLTFTDAGVHPGTTYTYQVTASDAAGNTSARSAAVSVTTPGTPTSATTTVEDTADAYVNEAAKSANYGNDQQLAVRGTSGYTSYLRFDLPAAPAGMVLTGAELTVRTSSLSTGNSTDDLSVQPVTGDWTETGVTWNTGPALDPSVIGTIHSPDTLQTDYSAALTVSALSSHLGQSYDLALTSTGGDSAWFWSHQAPDATTHPHLTLTFARP